MMAYVNPYASSFFHNFGHETHDDSSSFLNIEPLFNDLLWSSDENSLPNSNEPSFFGFNAAKMMQPADIPFPPAPTEMITNHTSDTLRFNEETELEIRKKRGRPTIDGEPRKRGRPPKPKVEVKEDHVSESVALPQSPVVITIDGSVPVKRRGRPPKKVQPPSQEQSAATTSESPKPRRKKKQTSPQLYRRAVATSVRSIPCFYFNCTYNYRRPNSNIIEISDRPLLLPEKFDGFTIRSCKKHHDRWKSMEKPGFNDCEICRGLNCIDERYSIQQYESENHMSFQLCRPCAERQAKTLGLDIELTLTQDDLPPDDRKMKRVLKKKRKQQAMAKSYDSEESNKNSPSEVNGQPAIQINEISLNSPFQEDYSDDESDDDLLSKDGSDLSEDISDAASDGEFQPIKRLRSEEDIDIASRSIARKKEAEALSSSPPMLSPQTSPEIRSSRVVKTVSPISFAHEMYATYDRHNIEGWQQFAANVKYTPHLHSTAPSLLPVTNGDVSEIRLAIRGIDSRVGLFADSEISESVCLGQYAGVLSQGISYREYSYRFGDDTEIDASEAGNEMRYIADSFLAKKEANVLFQVVDNHLFVFSLRKIAISEEIVADFGDEYRDRVAIYIQLCEKIQEYNHINLDENDRKNSAFEWFTTEGYKLLKQKGKVTVPIHSRLPAKKGLANTLSSSRSYKSETEWGYVAQLEKLDLERAREDCWVTFRAGKYWNYQAFESALSLWKSDRVKSRDTKKRRVEKMRSSESLRVASDLLGMQFPEIPATELHIQTENQLMGNSVMGTWKTAPVTIKLYDKSELETAQRLKLKFSDVEHPNLVEQLGMSKWDANHTGVVTEYLATDLQQWIMNPRNNHQLYIPRIALHVAKALSHLHSKGIVHGRATSSNVFLKATPSAHGQLDAKLNFDLVQYCTASVSEEEMGPFLAYEFRANTPCKPNDVSADIFSFGMLLCHLFSDGQSSPKRPNEVIQTSSLLRQMDPQWKELILDCTQKDPTERPFSFDSIILVLMSLVNQAK